ncbi:hypothetical protein [Halegenticoccus tardaugens]|uniref:hypothetical protein n=1 Tax=Halegenticoccus tardaugens TaxID=2071624 RepID=UPI001E3C9A9F|nr:hypothetical protein [Halegenticoccus tardaugens]
MTDDRLTGRRLSRRRFVRGTAAAGALLAYPSLGGRAVGDDAATSIDVDSPALSVTDRLEDRRYVVPGSRAYAVGTQDGRFPAMGFHTRGEMGGIWSPPIKLLDGIWFGIDGEWFDAAERFTSGYGHVEMDLPDRGSLEITRTEFAPDGTRAVLFGLSFAARGDDERFTLTVDAHSELMNSYPWGETDPSQEEYDLADSAEFNGERLVFRDRGTPPVENALEHDWAAVVGSTLSPTDGETGDDYRGPQDPPEVCPATGDAPDRCDDTEFGNGAGGRLSYDVSVAAGETETVWIAVAGADFDGPDPDDAVDAAISELDAALADPAGELAAKVEDRLDLRERTRLDLPDNPELEASIDWSKQNLADCVLEMEDLDIRETNAGENYPEPEGTIDRARFVAAGYPDYPWLFATDGEYTAFASVAVGQFGPIKDHLRALKEASEIDNDGSGKVVHEVVYDGSVYFGSNDDDGNTDETAKFPSAVALVWRWTGDDDFLDEMYDFARRNLEYIFEELDEDDDGWPEGLGNVEREGMGEEKLDNTVYTIRGLYDLADMARAVGDTATEKRSLARARRLENRFEGTWWFGRDGATQYADSLEDGEPVFQRHWIGVTPMEIELADEDGEARPGLASNEHGTAALEEREGDCYTDEYGMYHTGTGPTEAEGGNPGSSCDDHVSEVPSERQIFTLNTAVMAVGEGNYGRLGEEQQERYLNANAALQLRPDEQPGAMPEIAPSPDYGRSIDLPLNERAMVLQAWGAYGTVWPVVHQQLGVRPDLGRGRLSVVPQVPPQSSELSGENVRLGDGCAAVSVRADGSTYETAVDPDVDLDELVVGHAVPRNAEVSSVTLDGEEVCYETRETNRGLEILVEADPSGERTLVVETR